LGTVQSDLEETNFEWLHALQEQLRLKKLPPPASTNDVEELATRNDQDCSTTVTMTPTNEDDTQYPEEQIDESDNIVYEAEDSLTSRTDGRRPSSTRFPEAKIFILNVNGANERRAFEAACGILKEEKDFVSDYGRIKVSIDLPFREFDLLVQTWASHKVDFRTEENEVSFFEKFRSDGRVLKQGTATVKLPIQRKKERKQQSLDRRSWEGKLSCWRTY
jgi:hypothetical protein